jgi:pilus assembly protein Flp/PilA
LAALKRPELLRGVENFELSPQWYLNPVLLSPRVRAPRMGESMQLLARFLKDESAVTAIEYGLIAAGISIAIIVAVNGLGTTLNNTFTSVNTQLR